MRLQSETSIQDYSRWYVIDRFLHLHNQGNGQVANAAWCVCFLMSCNYWGPEYPQLSAPSTWLNFATVIIKFGIITTHIYFISMSQLYVIPVLKKITFISVLNVWPDIPGDPREILSYFEENYEQITMSYSFTFTQESNNFPFYNIFDECWETFSHMKNAIGFHFCLVNICSQALIM